MHFTIQLVAHISDVAPETREIAVVERLDGVLSINDLGLTLVEGKSILTALQATITDTQVRGFAWHRRPCPCCHRLRRLKDHRTITMRTPFGKLKLPSPRYERCRYEAATGVTAPIVTMLPERVTSDLLALETRWASLMAYGATVALLADVLPIGEAVNASTIRNDTGLASV